VIVTTVQGSDAQLMRLIATAVGLPPLRTRYALWRNFEAYCRTQYEQGKRVLLIFEDAHLMSGAMLRLLHGLSTITDRERLGSTDGTRRAQQFSRKTSTPLLARTLVADRCAREP